VRALTRRPQPPLKGCVWIKGSLEDAASLDDLAAGVDAVVHLAGAIKGRTAADFIAANVEGTRRLLAAMRTCGVGRLIHVSSLAAREPKLSDYAMSKAAAEALLLGARDYLRWTILRPCAVYGPGDPETLSLFKTAKRGWAPLPGGPTRTSLVHVDDVASAILAALGSTAVSWRTLDVHDGAKGGYALADVYRMIGAARGVSPKTITVPAGLLKLAGWLNLAFSRLRGSAPMLSPGKVREILHQDWTSADGALPELTGWTPRIEAREGLAKTALWYQQQGWL
jgi:nucleoside-diphosphate-sugar epimerase